jgi:hypothetical protein
MGFGHRVYKNYDPRARSSRSLRRRARAARHQGPAARHREEARGDRAQRRLLRRSQALPERRLLLGHHLPRDRHPDRHVHGDVRARPPARLDRALEGDGQGEDPRRRARTLRSRSAVRARSTASATTRVARHSDPPGSGCARSGSASRPSRAPPVAAARGVPEVAVVRDGAEARAAVAAPGLGSPTDRARVPAAAEATAGATGVASPRRTGPPARWTAGSDRSTDRHQAAPADPAAAVPGSPAACRDRSGRTRRPSRRSS